MTSTFWRKFGAIWGYTGVLLLLAVATYRLSSLALQLPGHQLLIWHYIVLVIWAGFMLYAEGYKAFGQSFSPRTVARTQYIAGQGRPLQIALAPLFCLCYFGAPRRRVIAAYCLIIGIVTLVMLIRLLPQPWRGVIDSGVALGLGYGTLTIIINGVKALRLHPNYITDPAVK